MRGFPRPAIDRNSFESVCPSLNIYNNYLGHTRIYLDPSSQCCRSISNCGFLICNGNIIIKVILKIKNPRFSISYQNIFIVQVEKKFYKLVPISCYNFDKKVAKIHLTFPLSKILEITMQIFS